MRRMVGLGPLVATQKPHPAARMPTVGCDDKNKRAGAHRVITPVVWAMRTMDGPSVPSVAQNDELESASKSPAEGRVHVAAAQPPEVKVNVSTPVRCTDAPLTRTPTTLPGVVASPTYTTPRGSSTMDVGTTLSPAVALSDTQPGVYVPRPHAVFRLKRTSRPGGAEEPRYTVLRP